MEGRDEVDGSLRLVRKRITRKGLKQSKEMNGFAGVQSLIEMHGGRPKLESEPDARHLGPGSGRGFSSGELCDRLSQRPRNGKKA